MNNNWILSIAWVLGRAGGLRRLAAAGRRAAGRGGATRTSAAMRFRDELGLQLPICVDGIENRFDDAYAAWPERFYALLGDKVAWTAQPKKAALRPLEISVWIKVYLVLRSAFSAGAAAARGSARAAKSTTQPAAKAKATTRPRVRRPPRGEGMDIEVFHQARELVQDMLAEDLEFD
uniref:Uncharacterized protein n=1 Tax=Alexandrium monilatum TaxID=311494 RepID=A0A7S4UZN9_9DINO